MLFFFFLFNLYAMLLSRVVEANIWFLTLTRGLGLVTVFNSSGAKKYIKLGYRCNSLLLFFAFVTG